MKKWLLLSTCAVACCSGLALLPLASSGADSSAGRNSRTALKIAFVDMSQLLRQYKKADELRDEVKATGEASNAKLQDLVGKGQELIKTLKDGSIDQDSSEFREKETKVYQLESYVKSYKASAEKEIQLQGLKATVAVHNEIQEALRVFSERNGFTIILRIDNEAATAAASNPQALGRVVGQDVIFHQSRQDITGPVVAYLNRRFESAARSDAATETPSTKPATPKSSPSTTPSATPRKPSAR